MSTSLKWIKASERKSQHYEKVCVRWITHSEYDWFTAMWDHSKGIYIPVDIRISRWILPSEIEWLEEKEIELPDWKEALEKEFPISNIEGNWLDTPIKHRREGAEWAKKWIENNAASPVEPDEWPPISNCIDADAPYEDMSEEFKKGFDFCLDMVKHFESKVQKMHITNSDDIEPF